MSRRLRANFQVVPPHRSDFSVGKEPPARCLLDMQESLSLFLDFFQRELLHV